MEEAKKRVLNNLDKMSEEEILKFGCLLALEKKKSLESNLDDSVATTFTPLDLKSIA